MQSSYPLAARSSRALATGIATLLLAGAALFTTAPEASAQDGNNALVDALVRKGVLTNKEASEIREDLARDAAQSSAGKIKLSNSVTELRLYGDMRLRYEYGNRDAQYAHDTSNDNQTSRFRFRLRINAEAQLGPEWFAGFSLGTGQPSDSEEQTFENGFDDYNIFITRAYLGWKPNDWFTIIGGKQKNPIYTTDLMWDADITPTGFSQIVSLHNLPFFGGSGGPSGYAKDDKTVVEPVKESPWQITLVAGQYIFDDNLESNGDSDFSTDAWMFVEQIITTYKFNKDTSFTIAPAFLTYTAGDLTGLMNSQAFSDVNAVTGANPITAQTPAGRNLAAVSGETRQLHIITAPGDVSFKLGAVKSKFYWDFAYNFGARERFEDIYQLLDRRPDVNKYHYNSRDGFAWLAGIQLGELKQKGDFALNFNYREVGLASIDPNLNDSTWAQSRVNQRGFKLGLSYQIADPVVFTVTGYWSWNLNDDVVGGRATNPPNIADSNDVKVLQVDLAVKF